MLLLLLLFLVLPGSSSLVALFLSAAHSRQGSLAAMAARMSQEIEVRDRHYRLRFYRSCFLGAILPMLVHVLGVCLKQA